VVPTALGTIVSSRVTTSVTTSIIAGGAGIVASEIGSSSLEGTAGIGAVLNQQLFEHCRSCRWIVRAITTALTGTEDLLLGDATTDAILSVASDSVAGVGEVADSLLVAEGEVGAGALSILPSWLLLALASELAFAVFVLCVCCKLVRMSQVRLYGVMYQRIQIYQQCRNCEHLGRRRYRRQGGSHRKQIIEDSSEVEEKLSESQVEK